MPSSQLAAVCLRYGALCALTTLSFLCSPLASAGTGPIIGGTPPTSATVGAAYSFQPMAKDPSGLAIRFTIYNKPSWATFNSTTGQLSGTPGAGNIGTYRWIQIAASDSNATSWLPSYTITVSGSSSSTGGGGTSGGGSGSGGTLSISGTPSTTASVGSAYSFKPTVTVPSGQTATFTVYNKPSWASFNTATGQLSGTPTASNVGTYRWVQIEASDAQSSRWLPSYTITVSAGSTSGGSTGNATVSWAAPTQNTNGSALTNLAGYHIYYGTSQTSLTHVVNITNPGLTTYVLSNLAATTWYFAMSSVNASGTEGPRSAVVSHTVQ